MKSHPIDKDYGVSYDLLPHRTTTVKTKFNGQNILTIARLRCYLNKKTKQSEKKSIFIQEIFGTFLHMKSSLAYKEY
jgi:hypothetical protein